MMNRHIRTIAGFIGGYVTMLIIVSLCDDTNVIITLPLIYMSIFLNVYAWKR